MTLFLCVSVTPLLFPLPISAEETSKAEEQYPKRRAAMVTKLSELGIRDSRVLEAMKNIQREAFLRPGLRFRAYDMDQETPVEMHQFLSRPLEWARALELLEFPEEARILVIDPGIGYAGALATEFARETYVIVTVPALMKFVEERFETVLVYNVSIRSGDPRSGWPEAAPFDRIFVAGVPGQAVLPLLLDQLSVGGILVAPEGGEFQNWVRYKKEADGTMRNIFDRCHFPPLEIEDE